jgi:hypothetical protein
MSEGSELQFDRAEYATSQGGAACEQCQTPLIGHYFDVDGRTVCEKCRYLLESQVAAGSSAGRFLRATGAGLLAAAAGAILYYAITAISGYEFGLIAIVVGYAVGAAVRWGSHGRGGWRYQTLAIMLTYLAIVGTYVPPIIQGLNESAAKQAAAEQQDTATTPAEARAVPAASVTPPASESVDAGSMVLFVLIIGAIAIAAPFLSGFENIIGLVIIGIGLYEAWKMNRRHVMTITGPHALATASVEPAHG